MQLVIRPVVLTEPKVNNCIWTENLLTKQQWRRLCVVVLNRKFAPNCIRLLRIAWAPDEKWALPWLLVQQVAVCWERGRHREASTAATLLGCLSFFLYLFVPSVIGQEDSGFVRVAPPATDHPLGIIFKKFVFIFDIYLRLCETSYSAYDQYSISFQIMFSCH